MNRNQFKKIWIISTVIILMFFTKMFENTSNDSLAGFILLMIIMASITGYKQAAQKYPHKNKRSSHKNEKRNIFTLKTDEEEIDEDNEVERNYVKTNLYRNSDEDISSYKGRVGEDKILDEIEKLNYKVEVIKNLIIKKQEGTTEVDIIMITCVGIFVFEVKNYSGWIFGNLTQKNWTQTFPTKQKESFLNPIIQNKGHIKALRSILDQKFKNLDYYSVIVFTDNSTLKSVPDSNYELMIERESNIFELLNASLKHATIMKNRNLLSEECVDDIFNYLLSYKRHTRLTKEMHVEYVKSVQDKN